jgi:hypothetical protein
MGKPVSTAQSHAVIATFMTTVEWNKLDPQTLQRLVKNPRDAGRMFTAAMKRPWTKHLRPFFPVLASIVLVSPERERKIGSAHDVFSAEIDPLFFSSLFISESDRRPDQIVDVWVVVEAGTAGDILDDFDFEEISFTQSQVVHIVDNYHHLLQKGQNCIPFKVSGVPYIAIVEANARGRLSIRARHYESEAKYDRPCYFILARKWDD